MEHIFGAFEKIKQINKYYQLSNEGIEEYLEEMKDAKVCTPIIGKFSVGKSAVINTILGYSRGILKEDITPETAVPTELSYQPSNDDVIVTSFDGTETSLSVNEYRNTILSADAISQVRIGLKNSFLESIPEVMLVDMPGFESGYEVHNKAIDRYLPKSLSYIIAFSAEDMVLRSSIGNILRELCLHDMPLCVVITKCDKLDEATLEVNLAKLMEDLKRFIGDREVDYCFTSSRKGNVEELKQFLYEIQEKSQKILSEKFKKYVIYEAGITENYLNAALKNSDLSESELDEKNDLLNREMERLADKVKSEEGNFEQQIHEFVHEVKADILTSLQADEANFIAMILNNQDISERVNAIIRTTITSSIQKKFVPKVQAYLNKLSDCIDVDVFADFGMLNSKFNIDTENISRHVVSAALTAVAMLVGPLLLFVSGIISGIVSHLIGKRIEEQKREEAKAKIRQKLETEVFPDIVKQVGNSVEMELFKSMNELNKNVSVEIENQKVTLQKAMEDIKKKKEEEIHSRENMQFDLHRDLELIGGIKNEL